MFESLLAESSFVLEKTAEAREQAFAEGRAVGREEGRDEGRVQAKIEEAQQSVIDVVQVRFPSLADELQQKIVHIKELAFLRSMVRQFSAVSDENAARDLFWLLMG